MGRPDVDGLEIATGDHKGKWEAEVLGFDYYDTRSGTIESGDTSKIAMWLLETDCDGRTCLHAKCSSPWPTTKAGGPTSRAT